MSDEIAAIEKQLFELTTKLNELRKTNSGVEIKNYTFATLDGEATMLDLFGENDRLLVIHNMGQGCRTCTLWPDWVKANGHLNTSTGYAPGNRTMAELTWSNRKVVTTLKADWHMMPIIFRSVIRKMEEQIEHFA